MIDIEIIVRAMIFGTVSLMCVIAIGIFVATVIVRKFTGNNGDDYEDKR